MATLTPTTRLEAVNQMLRAINESPVSSLTGVQGVDAADAEATLDEITRAVLVEGWAFNTDYDYPLVRNSGGEITVPANALSVKTKRRGGGVKEPVVRGGRMYDRQRHTFVFESDITADVVFGIPFEELPESARYYVAYRACRKFQDTNVGSDTLHRYNERDEAMARAAFCSDNTEDEDLNMLWDTPDFHRVRS